MNECNIVRDLMPLYADELLSADSTEFIHRHISWCEKCRETLQRSGQELPEISTDAYISEKKALKKAIRRDRLRTVLKTVLCFLLIAIISVCYVCYQMQYYLTPIEQTYSAPNGTRALELVERDYIGCRTDGYMIRFRFEATDRTNFGTNRYYTQWDKIDAHWAPDSRYLLLDVVTVDGVRELRVVDTNIQRTRGGLPEIPGLSENLIPELTKLSGEEGEVSFTFDSWLPDSRTIAFLYTTAQGQSGIVNYRCSDNLDSMK